MNCEKKVFNKEGTNPRVARVCLIAVSERLQWRFFDDFGGGPHDNGSMMQVPD